MNHTNLALLVTGGTFDKEYNELDGKLFFRSTHVHEMLARGRFGGSIRVETVFLIDSLEMTRKHREALLERCASAPESALVITHGTDTMSVTAGFLGHQELPKTIILTGAMVPYAFGSSDGLFNLGSAFAFAQCLPHGVYVAMNGTYFPWYDVEKDRGTGTFRGSSSAGPGRQHESRSVRAARM